MDTNHTFEVRIMGSTIFFPINRSEVPSSSSQPPLPMAPPAPQNAPSSSASNVWPEHLQYKNRLQKIAGRSNIALPVYRTINEGLPHAPKFTSLVTLDGKSYTCSTTFPQKKAAEQDAARVALEALPEKFKDEGRPLISENAIFSKSILNEYAVKLNVERPTYITAYQGGVVPIFVSTLVFKGTSYTGDAGRTKKDAEQLAACAAITSILGDSNSGPLYEIIKSKSRIYDASKLPDRSQHSDAGMQSAISNEGQNSLPQYHEGQEGAGPVAADNAETRRALPVPPSTVLSLWPESQLLEQSTGDGSGSKKRCKNKKKANKRQQLESGQL